MNTEIAICPTNTCEPLDEVPCRNCLLAECDAARKVIAAAEKVHLKHMCSGQKGLGCDACRAFEVVISKFRAAYPEEAKG